MKIAIICAMMEELNSILQLLDAPVHQLSKGNFAYYDVAYNDHQIRLILCGVGKVNAALHTQYIIDTFEPDYVINVGVAGGLSEDTTFGDVVIATDLVQYDVDGSALGLALGQIPNMEKHMFSCDIQLIEHAKQAKFDDGITIHSGIIASGDTFIDDAKQAKFIHDQFAAIACEMEGAAVAHVCYLNKTPFIIVRAISDMAGRGENRAFDSFIQLKSMVADRSSCLVKQLLSVIK
jgi:adenosylhomocysteine nucleosidase